LAVVRPGRVAVAALLLVTLGACGGITQPVLLKSGDLPFDGNICRIAVLPFANQTEHPSIERIFGRVFVSELLGAGNYQLAHEGDVRQILAQMRILPGLDLSSEQIRGLADRLGVQVVIAGAVLEVRSTGGDARDLNPSMAVVVRILEASSGRTIWVTYNRSEGSDYRLVMHFGLINTVSALAKKVSAELIDLWAKEGFKKCIE
jgi:TolB-like protein